MALLAAPACFGGVVSGKVLESDGTPLAGIAVSDGCEIVYTDADGR